MRRRSVVSAVSLLVSYARGGGFFCGFPRRPVGRFGRLPSGSRSGGKCYHSRTVKYFFISSRECTAFPPGYLYNAACSPMRGCTPHNVALYPSFPIMRRGYPSSCKISTVVLYSFISIHSFPARWAVVSFSLAILCTNYLCMSIDDMHKLLVLILCKCALYFRAQKGYTVGGIPRKGV